MKQQVCRGLCGKRRYIKFFKLLETECDDCFSEVEPLSWQMKHQLNLAQKFRSRVIDADARENSFLTGLSEIFSRGRQMVMSRNYFTREECEKIIQLETRIKSSKWEPIIFKGFETASNRFQKLVYVYKVGSKESMHHLPNCMERFIHVILKAHPTTKSIIVKLLKSVSPCNRQYLHVDDYKYVRGAESNINMSLNMLVALEENENYTQLIVGKKRRADFKEYLYHLTQGTIATFTGDFIHAEPEFMGEYDENYRLHFSIGTEVYSNEGIEVGVFKKA